MEKIRTSPGIKIGNYARRNKGLLVSMKEKGLWKILKRRTKIRRKKKAASNLKMKRIKMIAITINTTGSMSRKDDKFERSVKAKGQ